jgi:hypothetical protein
MVNIGPGAGNLSKRQKIVIESTTNCIWVRLEILRIPLGMDDVDKLVKALEEAKQHCGEWVISTSLSHG